MVALVARDVFSIMSFGRFASQPTGVYYVDGPRCETVIAEPPKHTLQPAEQA
jgi:hypothetical protein